MLQSQAIANPYKTSETMTTINAVEKTELVWPGKYDENGALKEVPRVNLPFQVIEAVNETRATREAHKGRLGPQDTLFKTWGGQPRKWLAKQADMGRQLAGDGVFAGEIGG